jgi:pyrophosphatase PpaX
VRHRVVLFDLDGTLIDSGAIILASMRHATQTVLAREIPDDQLLALVGGANLHDQMLALAPERVDELVRCYREHNEPLHAELQACPGVLAMLDVLQEQGRKLGIVTAKRRPTVELAFEQLPIEPYFDVVVTSEQTERHKPSPEPILRALELLGANPAATAYVGDSPFDIGAAKAAGVTAVGVTWGGIHRRDRLAAEEPDAIVDTVEELLGVV